MSKLFSLISLPNIVSWNNSSVWVSLATRRNYRQSSEFLVDLECRYCYFCDVPPNDIRVTTDESKKCLHFHFQAHPHQFPEKNRGLSEENKIWKCPSDFVEKDEAQQKQGMESN